MRSRAVFFLAALLVVSFIARGPAYFASKIQQSTRIVAKLKYAKDSAIPEPKCGLFTLCAANHVVVRVSSGSANIVGPKICFNGKLIMSHVQNNVGLGLNIVVANISSGSVESSTVLKMKNGAEKHILRHLESVKPGMIVLAASFGDVTVKMSDQIRDVFVGMGSTMIKSLKYRDNWVFVGKGGRGNRSSFEKRSINNATTNIYETYPGAVEVAGCFPKNDEKH